MNAKETSLVFTPESEPYPGLANLAFFDQLIGSPMEQNAITSPSSHRLALTDRQKTASHVIAPSLRVALSIRELIFPWGAHPASRSDGKSGYLPLLHESGGSMKLDLCNKASRSLLFGGGDPHH